MIHNSDETWDEIAHNHDTEWTIEAVAKLLSLLRVSAILIKRNPNWRGWELSIPAEPTIRSLAVDALYNSTHHKGDLE